MPPERDGPAGHGGGEAGGGGAVGRFGFCPGWAEIRPPAGRGISTWAPVSLVRLLHPVAATDSTPHSTGMSKCLIMFLA